MTFHHTHRHFLTNSTLCPSGVVSSVAPVTTGPEPSLSRFLLLTKYQDPSTIVITMTAAPKAKHAVNPFIYKGASWVRKTWLPAIPPALAPIMIMLLVGHDVSPGSSSHRGSI